MGPPPWQAEVMVDERDPSRPADSGSDGPPVALILAIVVAVAAVLFVASNRERVEIDFIVFTVSSRTWTALLLSIGIGVVLDRLFMAWWKRRRR